MKRKNPAIIIVMIIIVVAMVGVSCMTTELSRTVHELGTEISLSRASAILANAELDEEANVAVPIVYYDQKADDCVNLYDFSMKNELNQRQFEWKSCGYYTSEIETGLVENDLGPVFLPVAVGGNLLSNRGVMKNNFLHWFSQVEGKSVAYSSNLDLTYNASKASFSYESENFYPLNKIAIPDEGVNKDGNNHLFTLSLGLPFKVIADGRESFEITADDDTWVFLGDKMVIDMGGVHEATTGKIQINQNGEVYSSVEVADFAYNGVTFEPGDSAVIRVFHADRDSEDSVFKLKTEGIVLNVVNSKLANSEKSGVEVAYDPSDPAHVAPLGENLVMEPNREHPMMVAIIAQMAIIVSLAIMSLLAISVAWRYSRRDRNSGE